jgi:hypothetical protein
VEFLAAPLADFRSTRRGFAFRLERAADLRISARALDGREIPFRNGRYGAGTHAVELPAAWGPGHYTLRISGADGILLRSRILVD